MKQTSLVQRSGRTWGLLIGVGLLLGSLDLAFACTYWKVLHGVAPARILQGIASGWLGPQAFSGGAATAWLGAALHYAIMLAMVFVYAVAGCHATFLVRRPWLYGSLYGLLLYVAMNGVVVPLSAAAHAPMLPSWIISGIVVHAWVIGVPIACAARWVPHDDASWMLPRADRVG